MAVKSFLGLAPEFYYLPWDIFGPSEYPFKGEENLKTVDVTDHHSASSSLAPVVAESAEHTFLVGAATFCHDDTWHDGT
jgi:hypothetical protein